MLLNIQHALIWITSLPSFHTTGGYYVPLNILPEQDPRSIYARMGRRQVFLADHFQYSGFGHTQHAGSFTDADLATGLPFAFAVDLNRVIMAH